MAPFVIHHKLTDRKGGMRKKGQLLGGMMERWYHLCWDDSREEGVLKYYKNDKMQGTPKIIHLRSCELKADKTRDLKGAIPGFAITLMERTPDNALNIENAYEIHRAKDKELGSGAYSTVWKATDLETRKIWAVKEMQKRGLKQEEIHNLRDEVRISQAVGSHDNIVYMKEFVENKDKYYIVLEYLTGGELFDRIVNAPHGHFTVHRDLKPENFLLQDASPDSPIKIADFGFACNVESEHSLHGLCGSPGYVAPEIIKEKDGYGLSVDMWSMGVILYILLTGIPPFAGDSDEESFALTLRGRYDKTNLENISQDGQSLVAALLTYNPSKRAEASLNHPWLDGGAEDKVLRVQENLRSWRARMRFKKAIIATVATTRLHAIMRRAAARPDARQDDD